MRKPVHLIFVEEKNKGDGIDHNKFYDMFEKNGECHCYWGRAQDNYEFGKSGKVTPYPLSRWDELYNAKTRKGYEDKSHLYEDLVSVSVATSRDESKYAPIPIVNIANIVERLQKYANEVLSANYSVKAAKVTKAMVDESQDILNKLTMVSSQDQFNSLLIEIFKTIPRSMSRVDAYLARSVNDMGNIISREQDLLDIMRGQIITPVRGQKLDTVSGDKKTILELNGIEMSEVNAKDIEIIKRKLEGNASRLKNAWKVKNIQQKKRYDKYCADEGIKVGGRDTKLLWHGTRNENIWNILKTGLMLRPTVKVQRAGAMFGYGLYFAPLAKKSLGYTSLSGSYWSKGNAPNGFLILHEVAYGKPYDVYTHESKLSSFDYAKLRKACPGAHSLHAHAGRSLYNDEIIVYKEEQLSPLYLVEIG